MVGADAVSVAAVAMDACAFQGWAKVLHAARAPLADAAGVGLPAEANTLADGELLDVSADSGDLADHLVTRDEGVQADAPVVGDEMEIAVADATVRNGDVHILRADLAWVVLEGEQFCSRCMGCKSLNLSHSSY